MLTRKVHVTVEWRVKIDQFHTFIGDILAQDGEIFPKNRVCFPRQDPLTAGSFTPGNAAVN